MTVKGLSCSAFLTEIDWNKKGVWSLSVYLEVGGSSRQFLGVFTLGWFVDGFLELTVPPERDGSFLKEISVIVSMVWQAMTLLRSQHPGLGPGGSKRMCPLYIQPVQLERVMRRVGMVTSSLGVVKYSQSLHRSINRRLGLSNRTSGETGAVS
jgi:hypothetical protein